MQLVGLMFKADLLSHPYILDFQFPGVQTPDMDKIGLWFNVSLGFWFKIELPHLSERVVLNLYTVEQNNNFIFW